MAPPLWLCVLLAFINSLLMSSYIYLFLLLTAFDLIMSRPVLISSHLTAETEQPNILAISLIALCSSIYSLLSVSSLNPSIFLCLPFPAISFIFTFFINYSKILNKYVIFVERDVSHLDAPPFWLCVFLFFRPLIKCIIQQYPLIFWVDFSKFHATNKNIFSLF